MTHSAGVPGAGWVPRSPCGPHCLPAEATAIRLRRAGRVVALLLVLLAALVTAPLLVLVTVRVRAGWLRLVCQLLLLALGIRLRVRGPRRFADGGALVVANHLSWVEIVALTRVQPVRLVAKREVRSWPVIGVIAAATGTVFIDRRGLRSLPGTLAAVSAALRAGRVVAVFPEGTTWCGAAAGPFRSAPFQAALDAGVPVRPVGIVLRRGGRVAPEATFVGGQGLLTSVGRVLGLTGLVCELTVLPALPPLGDRAELARCAAAAVSAATGVPHPVRARRSTAA